MKFDSAKEFLAKLDAIGWFEGLPQEATDYIKKTALLSEQKGWEYSLWPEILQYTPLNILIGEHLTALLTEVFQKASYGLFIPKDITVEEIPVEYQDYDSFIVVLSFTLNGQEYAGRVQTKNAECLDQSFIDLINRAMYEQYQVLCFEEVNEAYGTIALANKQAVNKAKEIGLIPNHIHYWKELSEKNKEADRLEDVTMNWKVTQNVSQKRFYKDNLDLKISELQLIRKSSPKKENKDGFFSKLMSFFEDFAESSIVKFGSAYTSRNDVNRSGAYLSYNGHVLEVYSYNSDGADEEEIRFDRRVIYYSRYTMSGDEENKENYSKFAVKWANSLLQYLGLKKGGQSFQNFCIDYLDLPVGWIQRIFYSEDVNESDTDEIEESKTYLEVDDQISLKKEEKIQQDKSEELITEKNKNTENQVSKELNNYIQKLREIEWFKNLTDTSISEIEQTLTYNYKNNESFSPWPKGVPLPEYKDDIGDYTAILLAAANSSQGKFNPANIIEKRDLPLTQETSFISFNLGTNQIAFEIPFKSDFIDLLNKNIREVSKGLGFIALSSNESFICSFNQDALEKIKTMGLPVDYKPNYLNFSLKELELESTTSKDTSISVYDKLRQIGTFNSGILNKEVHGYNISLNSMKLKSQDGKVKEILYGSGGESHGESDISVGYLSYDYGFISSYSRQTDHVNHVELYYNGGIVHKSNFTAAGDEEYFTYPDGAIWANELLQIVGMEEGKEAFYELLTYGLSLGILAAHVDHMFKDDPNAPQKPKGLFNKLKCHKLEEKGRIDTHKSLNGGFQIPMHQFVFINPKGKKEKAYYGDFYVDKGNDLFLYGGKIIFNNSSYEYYKEQQYKNENNESRYFEEFYFDEKIVTKIKQGDIFGEKRKEAKTDKLESWIYKLLDNFYYPKDINAFIKIVNEDFKWENRFLKALLLDEPDLDLWQLFEQKAKFKKNIQKHRSGLQGIEIKLNCYELNASFAKVSEPKILFGSNYSISDKKKPEIEYSVISYMGHIAESYVSYNIRELFFDNKKIYFRKKDGNHKHWEIQHTPEAIQWINSLLTLLRLAQHPNSLCHLPYVLQINSDVFDKLYCGDHELNKDITYNYFK